MQSLYLVAHYCLNIRYTLIVCPKTTVVTQTMMNVLIEDRLLVVIVKKNANKAAKLDAMVKTDVMD